MPVEAGRGCLELVYGEWAQEGNSASLQEHHVLSFVLPPPTPQTGFLCEALDVLELQFVDPPLLDLFRLFCALLAIDFFEQFEA